MTSPTTLTLANLRSRGSVAVDVTERWVTFGPKTRGGIRKDWCGFADVVAIVADTRGVPRPHFIQCTTKSNQSSRIGKMLGVPEAEKGYEPLAVRSAVYSAICAGCLVEVWGWVQPGGKRTRWMHTTRAITRTDFLGRNVTVPRASGDKLSVGGKGWIYRGVFVLSLDTFQVPFSAEEPLHATPATLLAIYPASETVLVTLQE